MRTPDQTDRLHTGPKTQRRIGVFDKFGKEKLPLQSHNLLCVTTSFGDLANFGTFTASFD